MASPVWGLRPGRSARVLTSKIPKPTRDTAPCRQSLSHSIGESVDDESGLGLGDVGFLADGVGKFDFVHGVPRGS